MSQDKRKVAEKIGVLIQEGGKLNIENFNIISSLHQSLHNFEQKLRRESESEVHDLLKRTKAEYFIDLRLKLEPDLVNRAWDKTVKYDFNNKNNSEEEDNIFEIFERKDINGKLLIHGEAGSGKTTLQLELAKKILSFPDKEHPIPVLVNLAQWKPKQFLDEYIALQVSLKSVLRAQDIASLIKENRIFPLLDGLDELKPDFQASCIDMINQFIGSKDSPTYIVVSCRSDVYRSIDISLNLNNSIYIKELSCQQIENHLCQGQKSFLWSLIRKSSILQDLAKSPLFLNLLISVFNKSTYKTLKDIDSKEHLWDSYILMVLNKNPASSLYIGNGKVLTKKLTLRYLIWLSQIMEEESTVEFLIERIQPTWLFEDDLIKDYILFAIKLFATLTALFPSFIFGILITSETSSSVIAFFLAFILAMILIHLLISLPLERDFLKEFYQSEPNYEESKIYSLIYFCMTDIRLIESIDWSWISAFKSFSDHFYSVLREKIKKALANIKINLLLSFLLSTTILLYLRLNFHWIIIGGTSATLLIVIVKLLGIVFISLVVGFIFGFYAGLINSEVDRKVTANQGIFRTRRFLFIKLLVGFALGLMMSLVIGMTLSIVYFTQYGSLSTILIGVLFSTFISLFLVPGFSIIGLLSGLPEIVACSKHLMVRLVLYKHKYIPWNYAQFLDYCVEIKLLDRVGGRYRFIHKSLQEHFASMSLDRPYS